MTSRSPSLALCLVAPLFLVSAGCGKLLPTSDSMSTLDPDGGIGSTCTNELTPPEEPTLSTDACLSESLDQAGHVIWTVRRTVTQEGPVTVTIDEGSNRDGVLEVRQTRRTIGDQRLFESTEHLLLPRDGTLPDTFGVDATFSTSYVYNSAGKLISKAYDRAMDGTIDRKEIWTFDETGTLRQKDDFVGELLSTESLWDAAGNQLSFLDSGNNGKRWTYGAAGLLVLEEKLEAGVVRESTAWEMKSKDHPLHRQTSARWVTEGQPQEKQTGEMFWIYDAAGTARSTSGWGIPEGVRREYRQEFDERGLETLKVEDSEEPTCHHYQVVSNYSATKVLLSAVTTCDGKPFERTLTVLDAAGHTTRTEHGFYGNPLSISEDRWAYSYNACGAMTDSEFTSDYTGGNGGSHRQEQRQYSYDALGRLTTVTERSTPPAPSSIARIEYDDGGHVIAMNGKKWTYDDVGRVVRVDYGSDAPWVGTIGIDAEPVSAIRTSGICK